MVVGNVPDPRRPARDAVDEHRPPGQQVDVAREVARPMRGNRAVAVGGHVNIDLACLDNAQVDVGLPGAKNRFAVPIFTERRQRLDDRQLARGERGKRDFFGLGHFAILDVGKCTVS
jgi:SRSO17 transposase